MKVVGFLFIVWLCAVAIAHSGAKGGGNDHSPSSGWGTNSESEGDDYHHGENEEHNDSGWDKHGKRRRKKGGKRGRKHKRGRRRRPCPSSTGWEWYNVTLNATLNATSTTQSPLTTSTSATTLSSNLTTSTYQSGWSNGHHHHDGDDDDESHDDRPCDWSSSSEDDYWFTSTMDEDDDDTTTTSTTSTTDMRTTDMSTSNMRTSNMRTTDMRTTTDMRDDDTTTTETVDCEDFGTACSNRPDIFIGICCADARDEGCSSCDEFNIEDDCLNTESPLCECYNSTTCPPACNQRECGEFINEAQAQRQNEMNVDQFNEVEESSSNSDNEGKGFNTIGVIAGVICGVVLLSIFIIIGIFVVYKKRKKENYDNIAPEGVIDEGRTGIVVTKTKTNEHGETHHVIADDSDIDDDDDDLALPQNSINDGNDYTR